MENMNIEQMVNEVAPQVREKIIAQTAERIASTMSYTLESAVKAQVEKYVINHVMPDVEKRLVESHDQLVTAICESVGVACEQLRNKLIENVIKRMGDSFTVNEIATKIFGRGF